MLELGRLAGVRMVEYVEGQDLAKVVKERGPLPVAYACYYAREVALGLQHAFEKKMVHRDIKPQNLILARDERQARREGDRHFDLAKVMREKQESHGLTGSSVTADDGHAPITWHARSRSLDAESADIRADIYSLGCTLYYLLTGASPPFTPDTSCTRSSKHFTRWRPKRLIS